MITNISPREAELIRQIDEQGGQLAAWRDRAIAAEAELARLRAMEPIDWRAECESLLDVWRDSDRPYDSRCYVGGTFRQMMGELESKLAAPPAQPATRKDCGEAGCAEGRCGNAGCLPSAQPAEPVQRLSDERAAFEAWHNEYRTQELVRRDDTYYNTHVRCRWEGWQARAIESALQPGWRDIESAPKDGSTVIVGRDMGHFGFIRGYARWECSIDGLVPGWISCGFDPVNSNLGLAHPTHWQPIPPAPKATK